MNVTQRTVRALGWRSTASVLRVVIQLTRSILLARLLAPEVFGVFAAALVIKRMTAVLAVFGLDSAFIHRADETEDEAAASAVHFTLRTLFLLFWLVVVVLIGFFAFDGSKRIALIVVGLATFVNGLTVTPKVLLQRRVVHRRISLVNTVEDIVSSMVAIGVAFVSPTIWALLSAEIVVPIVAISLYYGWRPVWKPSLSFNRDRIRYFIQYGRRVVTADFLLKALDSIDDLYTSLFLGDYLMGLYARAYTFATYPRKVVAMPIDAISFGSYAELKGDRTELSQMFFRINALLVRSSFLFAGCLALAAPEFIRLVIGAKWLPFLDAFRLMLLFTMLDPIKVTLGNLFVSVGEPQIVVRARLIQLGILCAGLLFFGQRFGIEGIAVVVNVMLLVGIVILLSQAHRFVDYSVTKMFAVPTIALICALLGGRATLLISGIPGSDWRTGFAKVTAFLAIYICLLALMEREQMTRLVRSVFREM